MATEYDTIIKLLVIGNSASGKSSILLRFAEDGFDENYLPTIGVDFKIKTINCDGTVAKL